MSAWEQEFLSGLRAAALRARASGFDATADAIEAILRRELERRAGEGPSAEDDPLDPERPADES